MMTHFFYFTGFEAQTPPIIWGNVWRHSGLEPEIYTLCVKVALPFSYASF